MGKGGQRAGGEGPGGHPGPPHPEAPKLPAGSPGGAAMDGGGQGKPSPALAARAFAAVAAVLSWMTVSSMLILLNKRIMDKEAGLNFHYPMTLSGMGMGFSSVAGWLCCRVFKVVPCKRRVANDFYFTNMVPIGLFMALTLYLGNLAYLYLTVSFIQMLKAFTPVITMFILFSFGLEKVSQELMASVFIICAGTLAASVGNATFSFVGVTAMMLSETAEALRLVLTQKLLANLKFHPVEGLMYLAPACCFWLTVGALFVEVPAMRADGAFRTLADNVGTFALAAVLGFGVNTLAYAVIITSSSLTLKVVGTVKNGLVAYFGVLFYAERVTALQAGGYAVALGGFGWYNKIKVRQQRAAVKEEEVGRGKADLESPPESRNGSHNYTRIELNERAR